MAKINELLYCVKLKDEAPDFGASAEFLNAAELEFSSYEDKETKNVFHTVYAQTKEEGEANYQFLLENTKLWNEYGAQISEIEYFEMKKEDWAESWKKYFNIIHISERLIIKPSWLEFNATPEQVIVQIDPGMSFGTGQHATTSYCLKMIDKLAKNDNSQTFLDAGCGSGILSIAAKKLNYQEVTAFDFDPDACLVASENIEFNGFKAGDIDLFEADAENYQAKHQYDVVAANILGHLLIKFKNNINTWVKDDGALILAGILNEEFDNLSAEFCAIGYKEIERFSEKEWTSGLFKKIKA